MNLLASTFRNGEFASFASRRASSVLPTPVGPIMRMFLGITSSAISGVEFLAADAVAQRDGDGAFGVGLPDDVLVEFANDFARSQFVEQRLLVDGLAREIDDHAATSSSSYSRQFSLV